MRGTNSPYLFSAEGKTRFRVFEQPHARRCCSTPPRLLHVISLRRTLPGVLAPTTATPDSRWSSRRSFKCWHHHRRCGSYIFAAEPAPHARRWQARRQHARASTSARARLLPATAPHRCFFVWLQIARAAMHDASCALFHIVCEPAAPHGVCGDKCVDPCRYLSLESSARWLLCTWAENI